jgi:hypothetical protein
MRSNGIVGVAVACEGTAFLIGRLVQPKYPNDPLPVVVADFVSAVHDAFPADDIETVTEPSRAHQVTFHEVLTIWIPAAGGAVQILQASAAVSAWLRKRHREDDAALLTGSDVTWF